eukprot:728052-Alexandrium_andersonii.AAC.1
MCIRDRAQCPATAAYSLYVSDNGDPTRLCAPCLSTNVVEKWVGHLRFIMSGSGQLKGGDDSP